MRRKASAQKQRVEWSNADYGMLLSTPYSKGFTDRLKEEIPDGEIGWRGSKKAWWISDAYLHEAKAIVFEYFEV